MVKISEIKHSRPIDILLLLPHNPPTTNIVSRAYGITPPLGIGYVASYLKKNGFGVMILDNNIERLSIEQYKDYLSQVRPRYIGISLLTFTVNSAFSFARAAKEVNDDIIVIAGGPHASALPGEVLRNKDIDIIVKGEGEETMLELVRTIDKKGNLKDVKGIAYKENGRIIENQNRELIGDLDSLPMPAYELLSMNKYYLSASRRVSSGNIGSIITSRGCPYRCTFCSRVIFGQSIRYRSPEAVLDEIKYLVSNFGVRELIIWDDVFTLDKEHATKICRLFTKYTPRLAWSCYSRADHFSDNLYDELRLGGCRQLSFGIESGSQKILDSVNKEINKDDIERAIEGCRKHGLSSFCSFIIGFPEETQDTIQETINFSKKLNPDFAAFCLFVPLPGSGLFDQAVKKGLLDLDTAVWDNFVNLMSTELPPVQMALLDRVTLVKWQKRAFRSFYFRPRYILNVIGRIKSWDSLFQIWRGLATIIKYQLKTFKFSI